jgi:hypothetical protein
MNTKTTGSQLVLAAVLMAATGAALAQTTGVRSAYSYPGEGANRAQGVQLGTSPVWVSPYAKAGYGYDDNLTLADTNEISSNGWQLRGGFNADARSAQSVFQWKVDANKVDYKDSSADNFTDIFSGAKLDVALDRRNFLQVGWDFLRGHDARGSTDRGVGTSVDKYDDSKPYVTYAFGSQGAPGRVELYASKAVRRYKNNLATTESSDRDTTEYGGAFYWRAMPKTYVVGEVRGTDIDFKLANPNSAEERRYYVGVTWEATAATKGIAKIGRLERKPDVGSKFTGPSWEVGVNWAPLTYSTWDFYTSRFTTESSGLGSFILSEVYGANWTHAWNSKLSTTANAKWQIDKYKGFDRNDDIALLGVKASYQFRRWLSLAAEYQFSSRDSSVTGNNYDKNLWLLSAEVGL